MTFLHGKLVTYQPFSTHGTVRSRYGPAWGILQFSSRIFHHQNCFLGVKPPENHLYTILNYPELGFQRVCESLETGSKCRTRIASPKWMDPHHTWSPKQCWWGPSPVLESPGAHWKPLRSNCVTIPSTNQRWIDTQVDFPVPAWVWSAEALQDPKEGNVKANPPMVSNKSGE